MEQDTELQDTLDHVGKCLVDVTRTSAQLAASDVGFLRTSKPKLGKQLDKSNARLLQLTRKLLQNAVSKTALSTPELSSADDVDDNWRGIVDVIDNLLEKADLALDECTGVIKRNVAEPESQAATGARGRSSLFNSRTTPKPQVKFHHPPDNEGDAVFKPLLKSKPHALVSLEDSIDPGHLHEHNRQYESVYFCIREPCSVRACVDSRFRYKHPYQTEIEKYQFPSFVHEKKDPVVYSPLEASKATFVDTMEGVQAMLTDLKQATEIAIDLEHHDKHSYIGLVCLMQISTRDKDWVVDTLRPWRQDLQCLNEVFADPSILKVLHGSHMDIIWLQRDLGLYIVGLFDTFHAASVLRYPGRSLSFLLDKFANFKAQKQFQLADWRIRPLPKDLFDYARSDTHFLLYIYDNLRNELIEAMHILPAAENPIKVVFEESKKECLQRYQHVPYDALRGTGPNGWYNMLIHTPALFTKPQFAVFRAVHQWRDTVARMEDENTNLTMSKQTIYNIARVMPETLPALHGCAQPMSDVVRERVEELLDVVRKTKAEGDSGPDMNAVLAEHPLTVAYEERKAERLRRRQEGQPRPLSVGEVLQRERPDSLEDSTSQVQDVATQTSQFWGSIPWHSASKQLPSTLTHDYKPQFCLEIPLPPTQTQSVAASLVTEDIEMKDMASVAATKDVQMDKADVFVLRERARANKRKASTQDPVQDTEVLADDPRTPSTAELSETLQIGEDEEETNIGQRGRSARKEQKARKRAEKMRAKQALLDEQPFDYASAPSVLTPEKNKDDTRGKFGKGDNKGGVRPYAKSTDAPKGMPKVKRELKGKSMTFTG